jgi:isoaspartyl peptidase/L-asparaginase-like protein (Ntn-hydrolase superfamily)
MIRSKEIKFISQLHLLQFPTLIYRRIAQQSECVILSTTVHTMAVGTSVKTELMPATPEQQQQQQQLHQQPQKKVVKKIHYPFWFGGSASCFAAAVTHPLDLGMFFFLCS